MQQQHEKTPSAADAAACQGIGTGSSQNGNLDLLVHKLRPISRYSGSWEWIIVERCDGQSIRKVVETLYLYELRKGAWLTDIGLWKTLFDRTVVETVHELDRTGYISLLPDAEQMEGRRAGNGQESMRAEERKSNEDAASKGQRAREPNPKDTRRESERVVPRHGVVSIDLGGCPFPIFFAVRILRFLRKFSPSGDVRRDRSFEI